MMRLGGPPKCPQEDSGVCGTELCYTLAVKACIMHDLVAASEKLFRSVADVQHRKGLLFAQPECGANGGFMGSRLYVGGLPYATTELELRGLFEPSGTISSVSIVTDRDSGMSRGFGFVEMETVEQAQVAIGRLNGTQLGGRTLTINEAKERTTSSGAVRRDSSRGGYGGSRW
jgi:hypothetical protein